MSQQQAPGRPAVAVDEEKQKFFQDLVGPNFNVTASIYRGLHDAASGDPDKMTDELMNMMSDPMADERKQSAEADLKKREEAERQMRAEVERRVREELALQQAVAPPTAAVQSANTTAAAASPPIPHARQEELLREYARQAEARRQEAERKRAEEAEQQRRLEDEIQRRLADARRKREEEEAGRLRELEAKRQREEQARRFAEEARLFAEREQQTKAAEERVRLEVERRLRLEREKAAPAAQTPSPQTPVAASTSPAATRSPSSPTVAIAAPTTSTTPPPPPPPPATGKPVSIDEMRAVYDQKLRELEERLQEYDRKIQQIHTSPSPPTPPPPTPPPPPAVCVLTDNDTAGPHVDEVLTFLAGRGVKRDDVRVVNASSDFELVQVVKGQRDSLQFPCVIVRQTVVGSFEELKQVAQKIGVLEALVAGEKVDLSGVRKAPGAPTPPELKPGLYDYSISATEFTLKTVGTVLFLPIIAPYKLLAWAFGGKQPELETGEDIDVMQSNWYWRHQLRTMRFLDTAVLRLRPGYNDVRAAHKYDDVREIRLLDATNLVIVYKSGGSDYLRTTPADVKRICDIIGAKNKAVQIVKP